MRFVLLGCTALLLSGCGGGDQTVENVGGDTQNLTAETPPAGDTTAIDAATGADANMAADSEIPANAESANDADRPAGNSD